MSFTYGDKPTDFAPGQRVALHPASDNGTTGIQFGTVLKIGRKRVHIALDNGRTWGPPPEYIRQIHEIRSSS
jgi:hypothetical protein